MINVKYFSGLYPTLPREFLLQLDDVVRRLSRASGVHVELANAAAGAVIYQLPDGKLLLLDHQVVKVDSSGNTVTIYPATGQTILGTTSKVLSARYDAVHLTFCRDTDDWVTL